MKAIKVCLFGLGKTGKEIAKLLLEQEDMQLVAVFVSKNSEKKGRDLGSLIDKAETGLMIRGVDELETFLQDHKVDVAVDFTAPEATLNSAPILAKHRVRMVVGTTGFNEIQFQKLKSIIERNKTGLVYAPNVTLGVNVLMMLSNLAASILEGYDCDIVEAHFKGKKDAPSGTAHKLAKQLERCRVDVNGNLITEEIPVQSIRAGGIIGSHSVMLTGQYDMIEIKHESFSRKAFALGALRAVRYIKNRTGYYEMQEVLNMQRVMESYIQRISGKPDQKASTNDKGITTPKHGNLYHS